MKVIKYNKSYLKSLVKLFEVSRHEWPQGTSDFNEIIDNLENMLKSKSYLCVFLAIQNGEVIGYCDLKPLPLEKEGCYIDTLVVHPSFRRIGIGKKLIKRIIKETSLNLKLKKIKVYTWFTNKKAIIFYKKMGFLWIPGTAVEMVNFFPYLIMQKFIPLNFINKLENLIKIENEKIMSPDIKPIFDS